MQKIQFGLRQEHVVYLNGSGGATGGLYLTAVAVDAAEDLLLDAVLGEIVALLGVGVFCLQVSSSSSGSESIRMIPENGTGSLMPYFSLVFELHILGSFGGNMTQSSLSTASLLGSVASWDEFKFRFFSSSIATGSPARLDIITTFNCLSAKIQNFAKTLNHFSPPTKSRFQLFEFDFVFVYLFWFLCVQCSPHIVAYTENELDIVYMSDKDLGRSICRQLHGIVFLHETSVDSMRCIDS